MFQRSEEEAAFIIFDRPTTHILDFFDTLHKDNSMATDVRITFV